MLKVTIELWPGGDQSKSRLLGTMQIAQTSNEEGIANYTIIADEEKNTLTGKPFITGKYFVKKHNRIQSVYKLIAKAASEVAKGFTKREERKAYLDEKAAKAAIEKQQQHP